MVKVRIVSKRGTVRRVNERQAAFLVHRGGFRFADEGEPESVLQQTADDDIGSLTVAELRERVGDDAEIEGTGAGGNVVKADLVRALRERSAPSAPGADPGEDGDRKERNAPEGPDEPESGEYRRRDMRAED